MLAGPTQSRPGWSGYVGAVVALDLRSLAAFRIALAVVGLIDLAIRARDLGAHYTDRGILPANTLIEQLPSGVPFFPHVLLSSSPFAVGCLFVAHAAAYAALLIGYRTRLATLVAWLLLLSLHDRNPMLLHSGDVTFRIVLMWSLLLPLGARWSIDAARDTRPARSRGALRSWTSAGFIGQLLLIYFVAALYKLRSPYWQHGDGLHYVLNQDLYLRPFGRWLAELEPLLPALSWAAVLVELIGVFLVFVLPGRGTGRLVAVILFVGLHASFGMTLNLGIFPCMSIVPWLAMVPGAVWDRATRRTTPWFAAAQAFTNKIGVMVRNHVRCRPVRIAPTKVENVLACALLAYAILANARSFEPALRRTVPSWLMMPARAIKFSQRWRMFTTKLDIDRWYIIEGTLADGSYVDLMRGGGPISHDKPALCEMLPPRRWRNFFTHSGDPRDPVRWSGYARLLCRQWSSKVGVEPLESVSVYVAIERTEIWRVADPVEVKLFEHHCTGAAGGSMP